MKAFLFLFLALVFVSGCVDEQYGTVASGQTSSCGICATEEHCINGSCMKLTSTEQNAPNTTNTTDPEYDAFMDKAGYDIPDIPEI